ncbi:MAG: dihydroorotate dehydrogenase electron transfer subunit, partial [Bacilli bacterium]
MLQSKICPIISNEEVALNTYLMEIAGSFKIKAGQFINIKLSNHYLRRPISVAMIKEDRISIMYNVKGEGTKDLAQLKANQEIDILLPLGNGFTLVSNKKVLL